MDDDALPEMAFLYRYFHLIPGPQFYTLLCALTPKTNRWIPWIKTKVVKHSQRLLTLIANHYQISRRQANEYINVFVATEEGLQNLVTLCQSKGLNEAEVEALFDKE